MPPFERLRERYLDDDAYSKLQGLMLASPEAGVLIEGGRKNAQYCLTI